MERIVPWNMGLNSTIVSCCLGLPDISCADNWSDRPAYSYASTVKGRKACGGQGSDVVRGHAHAWARASVRTKAVHHDFADAGDRLVALDLRHGQVAVARTRKRLEVARHGAVPWLTNPGHSVGSCCLGSGKNPSALMCSR